MRFYFIVFAPNGRTLIAATGCLHGPIEAASYSDKDTFWSEVQAAVTEMRTAFKSFVHIGLADANARLGSVDSPVVGLCQPSLETSNGLRLRE